MRQGAQKLILALFFGMMALHVVFTFSGYYNDDDVNYARYAMEIAEHGLNFHPATNHFQLRWSTVYPAALLFKLFGINTITPALVSLTSFFLCGILLYRNRNSTGNSTFFLLLTLFFFSHTVVQNMHRLLPDANICLAVLWMYYSYQNFRAGQRKMRYHALSFAAGLFLAIITKETIIIALPLFLVFYLRDLWKKCNQGFWKYSFLFSLAFIIPYLLYFQLTTGNIFYRFEMLTSGGYFNPCSFDKMPLVFTINRLAYELWWNQLMQGDMSLLLPAISAVVYRKHLANYRAERSDYFAFIILLLSANFMSISWKAYVPLCPAPRHFIFILPFAAMIGARMLQAYFFEPIKYKLLPIFFLAATIVAFFNPGSVKLLYLLMLLILLSVPIFKRQFPKNFNSIVFTIGIFAFFFLNYLAAFLHPIYPYYFDQKKIIENNFSPGMSTAATIVSADHFTSELNEYLLNFKTGHLKFLPVTYASEIQDSMVYFLVNAQITPSWQDKANGLMQGSVDSIKLFSRVNNVFLYKISPSCMKKLRGW